MKNKIYGIIIVYFVLILLGVLFIKSKNNDRKIINQEKEIDYELDEVDYYYNKIVDLSKNIKKNATREEKEIIYSYFNYPRKAITEMCKKQGNWSLIPISDEMYNKYKENEGILGDIIFDSVIGIDEEKIGMAIVVVTKGKEKTKYKIDYGTNILIESIEIFETILLTDKDGNELDTRYKFIGDNIISNFNSLCYDGIIEEDGEVVGSDIAITDNFRKKYPIFLDLFIHYSPLAYNPIGFDIKKSRLEDNMAYFTVKSFLECKEREYEVYYTLDKNNYLDDVDVKCVKERELENDGKNRYGSSNAFYKNSNIYIDYYSEKFKKMLFEKGSYFPDIDLVDINYEGNSKSITKNECIYCLQMKNGSINSYYIKFIMNDKAQIDDVIVKKLPYNNMSAEEVKELYLKDLENNK